MRAGFSLVLMMCLSACGDFPTVDATRPNADYPDIIPLENTSTPVVDPGTQLAEDEAFQARAAALEARADKIRSSTP